MPKNNFEFEINFVLNEISDFEEYIFEKKLRVKELLRQYLESLEISQAKLAKKMGVSRQRIGQVMNPNEKYIIGLGYLEKVLKEIKKLEQKK